MKDYYFTDLEELEALRVERVQLKQEIDKLTDEIADLKSKLSKKEEKKNVR